MAFISGKVAMSSKSIQTYHAPRARGRARRQVAAIPPSPGVLLRRNWAPSGLPIREAVCNIPDSYRISFLRMPRALGYDPRQSIKYVFHGSAVGTDPRVSAEVGG